jgi:hypothetical protein
VDFTQFKPTSGCGLITTTKATMVDPGHYLLINNKVNMFLPDAPENAGDAGQQ